MGLIEKARARFSRSSERSQEAVRNIALSFVMKGVSIITSLLLVPLTINYINPTKYGIWMTLSSIIGWIGFFDLGLGNGFRNKFAEAKAKGDKLLASQYLSTTYFAIGVVVLILFIVVTILNGYLNWSSLLKIDAVYNEELRTVFYVLTFFFCMNMLVKVFTTLLNADQKPGYVSVIQGVGQLIVLLATWLLTKFTEGNLVYLAITASGIPSIFLLLISFYAFWGTGYKEYRPSINKIKPHLIKDIFSLGIEFFVIYLCLLVVFQMINLIITREVGPEYVTQYNIAHKYFNVLAMVLSIVITPFWSAFTDAYTKHDIAWMKSVTGKLEKIYLISLGISLLLLAASHFVYKIWVGEEVTITYILSASVMVYVMSQAAGQVYMLLINGIGTIRLQLYVYVVFALIAWPLMSFFCKIWGVPGVLIIPSLVYIVQTVLGKIQLTKLISGTACGIWAK